MRVCREYKMSHSVFLEWSDEDRAKAMAHLIHESQTCQRCGTQEWEWDPEQGGSLHAYYPRESICRGCEVKDFIQDDKEKSKKSGRYVELVPNTQ